MGAEAFDEDNGWGIPPADVRDPGRRDALEAELIYDAIEEEAVPLYYGRSPAGYPADWVRRCKRAMMTVIPQFNMRRQVSDYVQGIYLPAARQGARLAQGDLAGARTLAAWKTRVRAAWPDVQLRALTPVPDEVPVTEPLTPFQEPP
jgi:starch phosphorylase